ncbi:hypothetical protein Tsubulata_013882 [Turnera subulata]|uniref:RRN7-type domain-containing protein n=1 Tax=Turnera subulata TaxID=218843 RepID=A0A9Q0FTY7_9ROSI|nr:hypothetical protein Tsubulata_013882 [Turnera subulata]
MDYDEGVAKKLRCASCGHIGLEETDDGHYYCENCYTQADDIVETGVADEDFVDKGGGALYSARHTRRVPVSQATPLSVYSQQSSLAWKRFTQDEETPRTAATPYSAAVKIESFYDDDYGDADGPGNPEDFGPAPAGELKLEDYYNEVRMRYVMGMQRMLQLQCEALVEKFNVSPLICGIASSVWLRFVAQTGVLKDNWADDILDQSESQHPDTSPRRYDDVLDEPKSKHPVEPKNKFGQRAVMIWFRSLRGAIQLSSSLAISFLACHIAREAVLPTDIIKWSLEGKLPYFAAYVEIDKRLGQPSAACPISSSLMFRPHHPVAAQKLETMAAVIAESVGLHLPPVNFYEIASRYLKQLSLPVAEILPHACRIYEWSLPPNLWLSTNELRLPTRVCILSILIVAIRILYNIHGFGFWERSFVSQKGQSHSACGSQRSVKTENGWAGGSPVDIKDSAEKSTGKASSHLQKMRSSPFQKTELESIELLRNLEAKYNEIGDIYDYTKDLPSYLQYCKDVVFAGSGPSRMDNLEEDEFIERLWEFYQNEKHSELSGEQTLDTFKDKRARDDDGYSKNQWGKKKIKEEIFETPCSVPNSYHAENIKQESLDSSHSSHDSWGDRQSSKSGVEATTEAIREKAIRRLKLDMEENRFCYIKPRVNLKRFDYLHYGRKRNEGALTYVAHADYYILLRACARAAQVEPRIMHIGVLSFERRLAWIEQKSDVCLHLTPPDFTCKHCGDAPDHSNDVSVDLSKLSL